MLSLFFYLSLSPFAPLFSMLLPTGRQEIPPYSIPCLSCFSRPTTKWTVIVQDFYGCCLKMPLFHDSSIMHTCQNLDQSGRFLLLWKEKRENLPLCSQAKKSNSIGNAFEFKYAILYYKLLYFTLFAFYFILLYFSLFYFSLRYEYLFA